MVRPCIATIKPAVVVRTIWKMRSLQALEAGAMIV